jgi:phosphatidylglycerophosphate synthase
MMPGEQSRLPVERLIRWGALALGIGLFFGALYYINFRLAVGVIRRLGIALPLALFFSGLWHLARTWAWAISFPQPRTVSFARLARVRLAAEAFSYLTLRGIAGEPLKVVLLGDSVDARQATAAVAIERMAYLIGTTFIVGIGSVLAIALLPMTHVWFRVFRAFAIAAAIVMGFTMLVIGGRGTYFQSWLVRLDGVLGTSIAEGRTSRFISAVERQMLDLVRGNPARLAALLGATAAAYVCMALEAWVILRAAGDSVSPHITPTGALAVETFSRVASFASAFIPANLGALEASSLAAATAIGVGGGAALALARRLRGLFWAGVGLAIYPRSTRKAGVETTLPRTSSRMPRTTLLYLPHDPAVLVRPSARLAGLPIAERVLRPARRAGYDRIVVWLPMNPCKAAAERRLPRLLRSIGGEVVIATTEDEWRLALEPLAPGDVVTAIGAGTVVSTALLADAREIPVAGELARDVPAGPEWRVSGVVRLTVSAASRPAALLDTLAERRARALPLPSGKQVADGLGRLALRIVTPADLAEAEMTIRRASYKDTDAKVARFNRRMSLPISIALLPTPLTANQLSVVLVAIGFYSAWLFSTGHYWTGVLGGFLSLAASVLDGCDGEIARLKYQESALGCWIETVGDYSYYLAIFVGLTIGAVRRTGSDAFYWFGGLALCGTLLTFGLLIFLRTRITAGQPEKLHAIAKERIKTNPTPLMRLIWKVSFVATRATMPYGIMVFALLGLLPGIVMLAALGANIYWVTLAVKLRHLMTERVEESLAA